MRIHSAWPQWLSVPAAPVQDGVGEGAGYGAGNGAGQAGALPVRLLAMVADHGLAARADRQTGDRASRDCDLATSVTEARLDLGRHDAARVDPQAQCLALGPGTRDSRLGPAMDAHQLDRALSAGRQAIERAKLEGVALILAHGEAGAGAQSTNRAWRHLLDGGVVEHPDADAALIRERHAETLERADPYQALRCLGGFEHAALVGSALAAAQLGLAWRAVGTSAWIASLLALRLNPSARAWLGVTPSLRHAQLEAGFCLQYAPCWHHRRPDTASWARSSLSFRKS